MPLRVHISYDSLSARHCLDDCWVNDSCLHLLLHSTIPETGDFIKSVDLSLTVQETEWVGLCGDSRGLGLLTVRSTNAKTFSQRQEEALW